MQRRTFATADELVDLLVESGNNLDRDNVRAVLVELEKHGVDPGRLVKVTRDEEI